MKSPKIQLLSFAHSLNIVLNTYYVPGAILNAGDAASGNKTDKIPAYVELIFSLGKDNTHKNK